MVYSFKEFIEEKYSNNLLAAVKNFIYNDDTRCVEVKVRNVTIEDVNYSSLHNFKDHVDLPIVLRAATVSYDGSDCFKRDLFLSGKLSGTFSKRFRDIKIICSSLSPKRCEKFKNVYGDDLLPILSEANVKKSAEQILRLAYNIEGMPTPIRAAPILRKLGIKMYFVPLSTDGTIRGEYLMEDTDKVLYNEDKQAYMTYHFPANSILIEKSLKNQIPIARFSIIHEIVHCVIQKYGLWLAKMCEPNHAVFFSPVRDDENNKFVDPFIEKIERYADAVTAEVLMYEKFFRIVVHNMQQQYGLINDAYIHETILQKTAEYLGVSISACRKRFLRLGYEDMAGVYNYVDDHYVPPYSFNPYKVKKNQSLTLSFDQAKKILRENKSLTRSVIRGTVSFIENHFVINHPTYVTRDKKLTTYARNHLDECALKVDVVCPKYNYSNSRYEILNEGIYRTAATTEPLTVLYSKDNGDFESMGKTLAARNTEMEDVLGELPEAFPKALKKVMDWTELKEEEFAHRAGITIKTLNRLLSGETKRPSSQVVMRICIGLCLPVELSIRLMKRSGNELLCSSQDIAYLQLLFFSGSYTISDCNKILCVQGIKGLGDIDE